MGLNRVAQALVVVALLAAASAGWSQYYGEQVVEKSFEQEEFFFLPHNLLPYGVGAFRNVAPGLIDEPLLNAAVNPAWLCHADLARPYLYLDFRNTHVAQEKQGYVWPGIYAETRAAMDVMPYPWFYVQTRKLAEPIFSGGVLARPFGQRLSLGLTYQAVLQDQAYYGIPQDIYRARGGLDYAGRTTARAEDIPIVDRYRGTDEMHEAGHFLSLLVGYQLLHRLSLGAKLNRSTFELQGTFGSQNLWEGSWPGNESLWRTSEERTQDYRHWEGVGGLSYKASKSLRLGVVLGHLWGDAVQSLGRADSSFWRYRSPGTSDSSRYLQGATVQQQWDHHGKTTYGALTLWSELSPAHLLTAYYLYLSQRTELSVASATRDTSFSNYFYTWDGDWYLGQGKWALRDVRDGGGKGPLTLHRVAATVHWRLQARMQLRLGVNYERKKRSIATSEAVRANRHSDSWYGGSRAAEWRSFQHIDEDKTLYWDFCARETTVQIPLIFTWQPAQPVELLLGLNRSMKQWDITDVTTAIFAFRQTIQDSATTRKANFRERYTEPREKRSEVQTTFLAGITVKPSARLPARLLGVPHYVSGPAGMTLREMQWWLALSLEL